MGLKISRMFLLAALLLPLYGCEVAENPPSVSVQNGPTFILHGSGRLVVFDLFAPPAGQKIASPFNVMWMLPDPEVAPVLWQVEGAKGYLRRTHVANLQIVYGNLPEGCRQIVPDDQQTAPALSPGKIYAYSVKTFYGQSTAAAGGYFYVDERGGIQAVDVPDLCLSSRGEREVRVKCGTNEPYREPNNIELFVREHQKR